MKAIAYRQHQIAVVFALSFAAVGLTVSSIADAGNVTSGNAEVSKVQGRSSMSHVAGGSISTSGQNHAAFGRGTGSGHGKVAQRVATGPIDGALQVAGRGSTAGQKHAQAGSATRIAANR